MRLPMWKRCSSLQRSAGIAPTYGRSIGWSAKTRLVRYVSAEATPSATYSWICQHDSRHLRVLDSDEQNGKSAMAYLDLRKPTHP